jgi:uncharacterized protein (TIGR03083 family)
VAGRTAVADWSAVSLKELSVLNVRSDGAAIAAAARRDPQAPVPSCPGWTVHDLVDHLGRLHRWVGGIVRDRSQEHVDVRAVPGGPDDPKQRVAWFEEGVAALAGGFADIAEDEEVWNWRHGVESVRFWMRRSPVETAVHRWDAQSAVGTAAALDTELAVHGIDEMADLWLPLWRGEVLQVSTDASMHLHCTDTDGEWLISFGPDGATTTREHAKGDVAVRGSASDLCLLLWNRVSPERCEVFGDASLLSRFAEHVRI